MSSSEQSHLETPNLVSVESSVEGEKGPKFINENDTVDEKKEEEESPTSGNAEPKKGGRRKINIEFIENKSRRHVTFSKRKAGLIKKAYELSTLTGTQVLLLVASETGNVYTFATPKLQPLITKPEGKTLIQACLNPPDISQQQSHAPQQPHQAQPQQPQHHSVNQRMISQEPGMYTPSSEKKEHPRTMKEHKTSGAPMLENINAPPFHQSSYHPSSVPNAVMYPYNIPSMGGFMPSRVPYQYGNPSGYPQTGAQYSNQMQGQQANQPQYPQSSYLSGYSTSQTSSSYSSHDTSQSRAQSND